MRYRWAWSCCIAMLLPLFGEAMAQIIPVKTVPIAEGDQFTFLPSANRGMANVSIALDDTLFDPFVNPAKGSRVGRGFYFGSPSLYSLSRNGGDGSTLPIGAIVRRGSTFAGTAFAVQELSPGGGESGIPQPLALGASSLAPGSATQVPHTNTYAFASLGHTLARSDLSFAGSVMWSRLSGVDGVDLLYPGAQKVDQLGDAVNLRFGLLKRWQGERSFEALVVHNRYATTHDVSFLEFFWDPARRQPIATSRVEHNYDRTHLWGLQLQYQRPIGDSGWRVGAMLTGNRTTHPTMPTLGLMNLAGDPGTSTAYDAGIGLSRSLNATTAGIDAIYEPIWSRGNDGDNESHYRFSNSIVRAGVRHDFELTPTSTFQLQFGMQARAIRYARETSVALQTPTRSHQRWTEWTHTWATSLRLSEFQVHYQWRLTSGVERLGFPEVIFGPQTLDVSFFPVTPQLTMLPMRVTTQQLSITVPIR